MALPGSGLFNLAVSTGTFGLGGGHRWMVPAQAPVPCGLAAAVENPLASAKVWAIALSFADVGWG
jgi:hypothetical protein